jgi:hypothetical protein
MNRIVAVGGGLALSLASAFGHAGEYSANVALATDYVFRGISQTKEHGAIQGGLDAAWENCFSVGVWGSNVDFDADGTLELDYFGASTGKLGCEECSYSIGAVYYDYPFLGYSHELPGAFTLDLHLGYTRTSEDGLFDEDDDYIDWSVGVSRDFVGINFGLTYFDTDIDNLYGTEMEYADPRAVFAVSKSM